MKSRHPLRPTLIASLALLCVPVPGYAQSLLLTAEEFALLGGTSVSVGGAGPTTISNGNVGAAASINGFPPATIVNGTTILGGPVVGQALDDLITARNGLAALPTIPANNLSGQDLSGLTLAPGVYKFDVAAQITLDGTRILTLDAQGKNNVVWVFNIGTSLTTAAGAQIRFVNLGSNGGADNGLYWNAGTAITFGAGNVIAGNYLAGTDITFGTTLPSAGSASGRALALAGVSFDGTATLDVFGGPAAGGMTGDLTGGLVIANPLPDGPPGPVVTTSGYVLLSSGGAYEPGSGPLPPGATRVVLRPGKLYNTNDAHIDGAARDASEASPGSLTIFGTRATLTGINTHTGGTFVDGGTLLTSAVNLPASGSVVLLDSNATGTPGELIFVQPADGVFDGDISGSGSVTKQNAGTLTLTGANTYTGGTVIEGGDVIASTATLPAVGDIQIGAESELVFDQAGAGVFDGTLSGAGVVRKQGAGALTLARQTDITVLLEAGSLFMNGGVGPLTVASGARLGGVGTVAGNLVNRGTLAPGFSPGTILVAGNYNQAVGGTLVMEIAAVDSFDQLFIAGTGVIAGTLQVDLLDGYDPAGRTFELLTASGGLTGTFDTFTAPTGRLTLASAVSYDASRVMVTYTEIPFTSFAGTPNQVAVAAAAQQSPALSDALNEVTDADQFPAAFNALSPQGYQIWSDLAFARATALADRFARNNVAMPDHGAYYFDASRRRGEVRGDSDVRSSDYTSDSGLVGVNKIVAPGLVLGALFNYEETDAGLGSSGSETEVESYLVGARATWTRQAWFVHGLVAYGWDKYESTRDVSFAGTQAVAESENSGRQWLVDLVVGRHLEAGRVSISPFAGFLVGGWHADGFTETGAGEFNATVGNQFAHSIQSQIGTEISVLFTVRKIGLRPHVRAAWLHEFSNDARAMGASFGDVDFAVETRDPQRDSARLSAGLDVRVSPRTTFYVDFAAQTGDRTRVLSEWRGGVSIGF